MRNMLAVRVVFLVELSELSRAARCLFLICSSPVSLDRLCSVRNILCTKTGKGVATSLHMDKLLFEHAHREKCKRAALIASF